MHIIYGGSFPIQTSIKFIEHERHLLGLAVWNLLGLPYGDYPRPTVIITRNQKKMINGSYPTTVFLTTFQYVHASLMENKLPLNVNSTWSCKQTRKDGAGMGDWHNELMLPRESKSSFNNHGQKGLILATKQLALSVVAAVSWQRAIPAPLIWIIITISPPAIWRTWSSPSIPWIRVSISVIPSARWVAAGPSVAMTMTCMFLNPIVIRK